MASVDRLHTSAVLGILLVKVCYGQLSKPGRAVPGMESTAESADSVASETSTGSGLRPSAPAFVPGKVSPAFGAFPGRSRALYLEAHL